MYAPARSCAGSYHSSAQKQHVTLKRQVSGSASSQLLLGCALLQLPQFAQLANVCCSSLCDAAVNSQGWLLALVNIPEEAAEGIIIHARRVVRCMLAQCQLPKAATNLVATLAHLYSDQLAWHGLLLLSAALLQ
jgi:hypothetical protein